MRSEGAGSRPAGFCFSQLCVPGGSPGITEITVTVHLTIFYGGDPRDSRLSILSALELPDCCICNRSNRAEGRARQRRSFPRWSAGIFAHDEWLPIFEFPLGSASSTP